MNSKKIWKGIYE